MTELRGYQTQIAQTAGTTDPATINIIETLMRNEHGTLDALTPGQFTRAVMDAIALAAMLEQDHMLTSWCDGHGLALPEEH